MTDRAAAGDDEADGRGQCLQECGEVVLSLAREAVPVLDNHKRTRCCIPHMW